MTNNQIQNRRQEEDKRHNLEQESIGRKSAGAQIASSIGKVLGSINDPSWYNLNPQLVRDVASLSFNTPLGRSTNLPSRVAPLLYSKEGVPGVLNILFAAGIGTSEANEATAANIAAKKIYSFTRAANSGARVYEAVDEMLYLLAMDSAYMFYAQMLKIYALVVKTNAYNYYYPEGLIRSMGLDYYDLMGNIAQLRGYINVFAQRVSAFNVPAVLPYYHRHMWMCSNLFKDQDINRSQLFQFIPRYLHVYNDKLGQLDAIDFLTGSISTLKPLTYVDLVEIGNRILTGLVSSEDIGTMSGDILKAYGQDKLFILSSIDDSFTIEPVYSQEVLSQINSLTLIGTPDSTQNLNFSQDDKGYIFQGYWNTGKRLTTRNLRGKLTIAAGIRILPQFWIETLKEVPAFTARNLPNMSATVINLYKDDVTPDDNMIASRGCATGELSLSEKVVLFSPSAYGSELFLQANITYVSEEGKFVTTSPLTSLNLYESAQPDLSVFETLARYEKFDWAPILFYDLVIGKTILKGFDTFDTANFAILHFVQVRLMHEVALESLFGVPETGNLKVKTTETETNGSKHKSKSKSRRNSKNKGANGKSQAPEAKDTKSTFTTKNEKKSEEKSTKK